MTGRRGRRWCTISPYAMRIVRVTLNSVPITVTPMLTMSARVTIPPESTGR